MSFETVKKNIRDGRVLKSLFKKYPVIVFSSGDKEDFDRDTEKKASNKDIQKLVEDLKDIEIELLNNWGIAL